MIKKTIILGVCNANNSGASLFINGNAISSVNEERMTRIKNDTTFPIESIKYCLNKSNLTVSDIDYVACGAWGGIDEKYVPFLIEEIQEVTINDPKAQKLINDRSKVATDRDLEAKQQLIEGLLKMGFKQDQVSLHDHHLSHTYTAFYPSPFQNALVFTLDGRGDFKSGTISQADREKGVELLYSSSMYSSLGAFYGFITKYLGFTPDRHEGKLTGLAAFGDSSTCIHILRNMISYKDGKIISNIGDNYTPFMTGNLPVIEEKLKPFSKEDIAAAVQDVTEEIVLAILKKYLNRTGLRNVCLAGGVFGNVKLNQRILELDLVDNIYVFPAMGDGGNAFGGGLIKMKELDINFNYPLKSALLGHEYSDEEIIATINEFSEQLTFTKINDYGLNRIAKELYDGRIFGLFTSKMEFGPRSLGSRSIIARATDKIINNSLNDRLHRTEFMPFAPVTLETEASSYYIGWEKNHMAAHFMTVCYDCTERAANESPAVVHIDNTARPQIINEKNCAPLYFEILSAYYKETNIPTLINTSFNNHEEPIVCSPFDAIDSLLKNNVDSVILENYVVTVK